MLRRLALLLLLANLLFFAWSQGWLTGIVGLRPHPEREPERLARQVRPETVVVLPPGPSAASTLRPMLAAAPAGSASAEGPVCLEAGLRFSTNAGPVFTGGDVGPFRPYLPSGSYL